MNLQELMKTRRAILGLSQNDIADALEFSPSYIADVEAGRRAPFSYQKLAMLADILKVSDREILDAALLTRGLTLFPVPSCPRVSEQAIIALHRRWTELKHEDFLQILRILLPKD